MDLYNATSAPATLPVSVAEAKDHLQLPSDYTEKDSLLTRYIRTAQRVVETKTGLVCFHTTFNLIGDVFPTTPLLWPNDWLLGRPFRPLRQPLVSVASITYRDPSGTTATLSPSRYAVVAGKGGYVRLTDNTFWPAVSAFGGAIAIDFTAGFHASDPASIPDTIRSAILLLVAHYWVNREPINIGNIVNEIPFSVRALLDLEGWGSYE